MTSRNRYLMVKAGRLGQFNYEKFNPYRKRDMLRLHAVLHDLEAEETAKVLKVKNLQNLVGSTVCKEEDAKKLWSETYNDFDKLLSLILPWLPRRAAGETLPSEIDQAIKMWEDHFGSLDDPEVQARVLATAKALDDQTLG